MTSEQASRERERLWRELKPLLVRSLGREGAAEWLAFAAEQMLRDAARDVVVLPKAGWSP
jgi:hypothetical protein